VIKHSTAFVLAGLLTATLSAQAVEQQAAIVDKAEEATPAWVLGVTQDFLHSSNVAKTPDGTEVADWISTTGLEGRLTLPFGLQTLHGLARVSALRHRERDSLDANPYRLAATLDWSAGRDSGLRGNLGAEVERKLYIYDQTGALAAMERNSQVFARAQYGLTPDWALIGGLNLQRRDLSLDELVALDQRQSAVEAGVRNQPSPDLDWRLNLRYTDGRYPERLLGQADDYRRSDLEGGVNWSWTSTLNLNAVLGWGRERHSLQGVDDISLWYGSATLNWQPTAKLKWQVKLERNSDTGMRTSAGLGGGDPSLPVPTPDALSNASVATGLAVGASWAATAKVSLDGRVSTVRRNLSATLNGTPTDGSDRVNSMALGVRYTPQPSLELGCRVLRERRRIGGADSANLTFPYEDTSWGCWGKFWFGTV